MYEAIGIGSKIGGARVLTHAASPFRCPRAWDQFIEVVHSRSQIQNADVTMGINQSTVVAECVLNLSTNPYPCAKRALAKSKRANKGRYCRKSLRRRTVESKLKRTNPGD